MRLLEKVTWLHCLTVTAPVVPVAVVRPGAHASCALPYLTLFQLSPPTYLPLALPFWLFCTLPLPATPAAPQLTFFFLPLLMRHAQTRQLLTLCEALMQPSWSLKEWGRWERPVGGGRNWSTHCSCKCEQACKCPNFDQVPVITTICLAII